MTISSAQSRSPPKVAVTKGLTVYNLDQFEKKIMDLLVKTAFK